jgi:hypothetical protein
MRLSTPFVIAALALGGAGSAQDEGRRIVVRDVTREVVREVMGASSPAPTRGATTARSRPSASRAR